MTRKSKKLAKLKEILGSLVRVDIALALLLMVSLIVGNMCQNAAPAYAGGAHHHVWCFMHGVCVG